MLLLIVLLLSQVQNEDLSHERLQMFNKLWTINFSHDSLLIFSTGRSPNLFCQLWVSLLPPPAPVRRLALAPPPPPPPACDLP
jgi:hypothetical protein